MIVMNMIGGINKLLGIKPKVFLVNDDFKACSEKDVDIVKSMNVDVEQFSDLKQLLYTLRATKRKKYTIGIIRENINKYPSRILSNFIKSIDPTIKLIIYKDEVELRQETKSLTLT